MKNLLLALILLPTLCLAGPGGVGGGNGSTIMIKKVDQLILNEEELDQVLSLQMINGEVISVADLKDVFSFEGKVMLPMSDILDVQLMTGEIIGVGELEKAFTPSYFCDPTNFTDDCHHY